MEVELKSFSVGFHLQSGLFSIAGLCCPFDSAVCLPVSLSFAILLSNLYLTLGSLIKRWRRVLCGVRCASMMFGVCNRRVFNQLNLSVFVYRFCQFNIAFGPFFDVLLLCFLFLRFYLSLQMIKCLLSDAVFLFLCFTIIIFFPSTIISS